MPSDDQGPKTVIAEARFLIVASEATVADALKRFLLSEGAPAAHVAPNQLLALRILQDRRTPIDCVICAHRPDGESALDFLANLRAGRWGGLSLQQIKFVLLMKGRDENIIAAANNLRASGFIAGNLDKASVRESIIKALDPRGTAKAAPNFKIAQLRASEADLIIAAFPPSFARLSFAKQQEAVQAVTISAQANQMNGIVAAVYAGENGTTGFLAPQIYHRFLSKLSMDFVGKLPGKMIYVEWSDGDPTVEPESAAEAADEPLKPLPLFHEDEEEDQDAADRRRLAPQVEKVFGRGLTEDDIRAVATAFKEMGPQDFVQRFVRHQAISLQGPTQPLTPMMNEFFVSMELLRKAFFPGVEMRGSKRAFQSLTHMLDQLMLRSLDQLPQNGVPASLNLNVHSILSKTFETALQKTRIDNLTFEIPQPMIGSYFAEFKRARDLIYAHGGKIAVDQIFPDTIGALDLSDVAPNIAKLHWKGDLKNFSQSHRDFVKKTIDGGVTMILSRVDDPSAFEIGQDFGIQNFQGFLIDEMGGTGK